MILPLFDEFVAYDFRDKKWNLGDISKNNRFVEIPQNSCITLLEESVSHNLKEPHLIVTGGILNNIPLKSSFDFVFKYQQ